MCDTLVALGNSTKNKTTLFAKNSDRDPNEAHYIDLVKETKHSAGEMVKCTYIDIPQINHTYRVLLAKPFWIWGGEMGANEFGVVIGNEAVFTKVHDSKTPRLLGMDLLRLALERSKSADEALHVIIDLLTKYGQGGNCGFAHPFFYDNSFIIADASTAWVLETAGKQWVAEKVTTVRSISNRLTIGNTWDLASDDLVRFAMDKGWCRNRIEFNFRKCYADPVMNYLSGSALRIECTRKWFEQRRGHLSSNDMMEILRQHPSDKNSKWTPDKGFVKSQVCMHIGVGPIRINQTTGSMVSEIGKEDQVHWFTGTSSPCLSVFKPVWINAGIPINESVPQGVCDESTLWWRHEAFARKAVQSYLSVREIIANDQKNLEQNACKLLTEMKNLPAEQKMAFTKKQWEEAEGKLNHWNEIVKGMIKKPGLSLLYLKMIHKHNHAANLE